MKVAQRIKLFSTLFFSLNKNYFFEKYQFLNFSEKNKILFFKFWYLFKNQVSIFIIIVVLQLLFNSVLLNTSVLIGVLLSLFIGMDTKDWSLFYRVDFVSAIPNVRERFLTILFGNIIFKLFIERNIVVLLLLLFVNMNISFIYFPLLMLFFMFFYSVSISVYFLLQNSMVNIKKIFSIVNYLFSMLFTLGFVYFLLDFIFAVFIVFTDNLNNKNILPTFFNEGKESLEAFFLFFSNHKSIIIAAASIYIVSIVILNYVTLNYLEQKRYLDQEDEKKSVKNFVFVKATKKTIAFLSKSKQDIQTFINKELNLFMYIYKYNFRDYFFIFIADRSLAFLLAIFFILLKFEYEATYLLLFIIVPIILLMDINSNVGVKLISNMSFITDYNTLLNANTSGFDIKKLVEAKLKFYYSVKIFAYLFFFLLSNAMFFVVHMPLGLLLVANILNILIVLIFPKVYLTNNLIYSRMNYKNYQQYLEESKILDYGVAEFYPLNFIFRIWILTFFFVLIFSSVFDFMQLSVLLAIAIVIMIVSIVIVYQIMQRIYRNIIGFIERGNYSVDFVKIFK